MVTHDGRFAKHAERTIHLFDGQVVKDQEMRETGAAESLVAAEPELVSVG
jgi:putative ABC transport system ATP-binding protein